MATAMPSAPKFTRSRFFGAYLFIFFFLCWIVTSITVNYTQANHYHQGTGFGDTHTVSRVQKPNSPYYP
jgi:hypothetical protein